jgi:RimJ/RimL family protein N-acetyltransferase
MWMRVPEFHHVETPRLVLRRLRDEDLPALVAYRSDPEVARYQSWSDYDAKRGRELIEMMRTRQPGEPGWFQFAIALKDTNQLVGDSGFRVDEADPRLGELGFTLAPAHQGWGLGTEAVRGVLDYAFTTLGLHRVMAVTDALNVSAAKVLERVGMRREAHFREHVWFKGAWGDEFVYALLGREWAAARGKPS